ncbi:MAG: diaminopimelate epimerase [Candidatus Eremiobacter antarcticus]|nr:diaminopimelate epimerase [Candidatus Eremiobacteraeota bacterium]MBC5808600.1 diaminopimelate epimerase [Candidatus Eremiobacteraeota bacterium]PZR61134.1 MAG: diaminopimelate epimerase [Candidatus Eremiobacter sp. RRmetagenome_bin22]
MPVISVTKCQAAGNDFILYDARRDQRLPYAQLAKLLCSRRFSVGADGLLVLSDPLATEADVRMQVFNADGSEAEMCGNGVRCVARYMWEADPAVTDAVVETASGSVRTSVLAAGTDVRVRATLGVPGFLDFPDGRRARPLKLDGCKAIASLVSMGNRHLVCLVDRSPQLLSLSAALDLIDSWKLNASSPNVELARVTDGRVEMRVHERGVGETWACGSGACAAAACAMTLRRAPSPLRVETRGGAVSVAWTGPGQPAELTGDAHLTFQARVDLPLDLRDGVEAIGADAAR